MPQYSYSARDASKSTVQGTVDAPDEPSAMATLKEMGLGEVSLSEQRMDPSPSSVPPPGWTVIDEPMEPEPSVPLRPDPSAKTYMPLIDTIRLYAGWLLAGYFLTYALGSYQWTKPLPFEIPFVLAFVVSPLVLSFSLAAFLFLLVTELYRATGKQKLLGVLFTLLGIATFALYRLNT
ncbi:MAG: hypothetical protein V1926_04615 [Candidatus Peregrinibacteria bacterium]